MECSPGLRVVGTFLFYVIFHFLSTKINNITFVELLNVEMYIFRRNLLTLLLITYPFVYV